MFVFDFAVLDPGQGSKEFLRPGSGLVAVDHVIAPLESDLPHRTDDRGRAGAENFGQFPGMGAVDDFFNGDPPLFNREAQFGSQFQDRFAGNVV